MTISQAWNSKELILWSSFTPYRLGYPIQDFKTPDYSPTANLTLCIYAQCYENLSDKRSNKSNT